MHILVLAIVFMTAGIASAQTSATGPTKPIKMVVLGDSLSAGLGLSAASAFPVRLQKSLKINGIDVDMINAGVSGDTSSGGRDRLDWSVPPGTDAVILELGANDALRGTDPKVTRAALTDILTQLKARGVAVLLCGMVAPPNYGSDYAARFNAIYPDLAKSFGVPLYPSLRISCLPCRHLSVRYPGNAVEKQAVITLMRCFPGSFVVLELRMLRTVI